MRFSCVLWYQRPNILHVLNGRIVDRCYPPNTRSFLQLTWRFRLLSNQNIPENQNRMTLKALTTSKWQLSLVRHIAACSTGRTLNLWNMLLFTSYTTISISIWISWWSNSLCMHFRFMGSSEAEGTGCRGSKLTASRLPNCLLPVAGSPCASSHRKNKRFQHFKKPKSKIDWFSRPLTWGRPKGGLRAA